ncbi:hypothetical protein QUR79_10910 [Arcobacter cryaerophilus gv. pseudocryaerophilus]|uniref:Uncharacterized protein n=2 Tax=Arcobacteraceae TaxID=2808963 RepID=A0AAU0P5Q7_9BACT|nr:hypothetical protein RJG54_07855 [Arcobacter sp. AZ-2023]WPD03251.1 hypothetical protein QUR79_10910 [Arcobacter sp. DSM 115972]
MKKTIYIGIAGNRDISNEQSIFIKENIENFLKKSLENKSFEEIVVLTPLADGVDRIIADVVLDNFSDMRILIPLPFSENLYKNTFGKGLKINNISNESSIKDYEDLLEKIKKHNKCDDVYINLKFEKENYLNQNIDKQREIIKEQYSLLGEYFIEKSDILIAVYDRNREIKKGGTIEIVNKFNLKMNQNKKLFEINI